MNSVTQLVGGPLDGHTTILQRDQSSGNEVRFPLAKRASSTHTTYVWTTIGNSATGNFWILRHNKTSVKDAIHLLLDSYKGATSVALKLRAMRRVVKNKNKYPKILQ